MSMNSTNLESLYSIAALNKPEQMIGRRNRSGEGQVRATNTFQYANDIWNKKSRNTQDNLVINKNVKQRTLLCEVHIKINISICIF